MGHGQGRPVKTREWPHEHGGRHSSSSSNIPHLMGSSPGRPVKTHGPPHGPGGAADIELTSHGPRPGLAHQISRGWGAARSGPSIFQRMGLGPARPIKLFRGWAVARLSPSQFQFFTARAGPAHPIFKSFGPAQHVFKSLGPARHNFQISPARPSPDKRPMTSPGNFRIVWDSSFVPGKSWIILDLSFGPILNDTQPPSID